jgi:hypothetical protein
MRSVRAVITLALALAAAGCTGPDHIEMDPNQLTFTRRGSEVWVHALFKDHKGKQFPKEAATWSSSNEQVAKVDNKEKPGNVVAVGPGHATITVKGEGELSAELPVDVVTVEKVTIEPNPFKIPMDETLTPKVEAFDVNGRLLRDRKPHFKCNNDKLVQPAGDGLWSAGEPGTTTCEVAVDDKTVILTVAVDAPAKGAKKK